MFVDLRAGICHEVENDSLVCTFDSAVGFFHLFPRSRISSFSHEETESSRNSGSPSETLRSRIQGMSHNYLRF